MTQNIFFLVILDQFCKTVEFYGQQKFNKAVNMISLLSCLLYAFHFRIYILFSLSSGNLSTQFLGKKKNIDNFSKD